MKITPETGALIRELWLAGVPASEIGRRAGLSKNSVVSFVHRRGLPLRGSPIKPLSEEEIATRRDMRASGATWAEIGRAIGRDAESLRRGARKNPERFPAPAQRPRTTLPSLIVRAPKKAPAPLPRIFPPARECLYLHGETPPFRQCGAPVVTNRWPYVYCADHLAQCLRPLHAAEPETPGNRLIPAGEAIPASSPNSPPALVGAR